ncbi:MAG: iron complex outermembrane receptor protein [Paraglaciecola sp.]|jgi:iron complex outermembrane receptor protein
MKNTRLKRNAMTIFISAVLGLMVSSALFAEELQNTKEKEIEKISVIGLHLKGSLMETSAAVQTIARADLERIGSPSIVQVTQKLSISSGIQGNSNQYGSNGTEGKPNINIRGLGANRTLVLINGRRLLPSLLIQSINRSPLCPHRSMIRGLS